MTALIMKVSVIKDFDNLADIFLFTYVFNYFKICYRILYENILSRLNNCNTKRITEFTSLYLGFYCFKIMVFYKCLFLSGLSINCQFSVIKVA